MFTKLERNATCAQKHLRQNAPWKDIKNKYTKEEILKNQFVKIVEKHLPGMIILWNTNKSVQGGNGKDTGKVQNIQYVVFLVENILKLSGD